jgi:hypothetical protein
VRLGETSPLVVDTSELHLFDPSDGTAIAAPVDGSAPTGA